MHNFRAVIFMAALIFYLAISGCCRDVDLSRSKFGIEELRV